MYFKHFAARKVFEKSQKLFKPVYVEKAIQTKKTQGDIKRFLCFFWAVCFPVFLEAARPDTSKKQKQGSLGDAKASPCGAALPPPAPRISIEPPGRRSRRVNPRGGWGFGAGLLSSWGSKILKKKPSTRTSVK
jgi:hypothetical protein